MHTMARRAGEGGALVRGGRVGSRRLRFVPTWALIVAVAGCSAAEGGGEPGSETAPSSEPASDAVEAVLNRYVTVPLTTDLAALAPHEQEMIPLLIEAVEPMNWAFWAQAFGTPMELLDGAPDARTRRALEANFGPWDRLAGNAPFLPGFGEKPAGANFYPRDMTREEFEAAAAASVDGGSALRSLYTLVRRNEDGSLRTVPYREAFRSAHTLSAEKLRAAAALARDEGLRRYLEARADALLTDEYQASDLAWMDMKDNGVDVMLGPIETYEDQLFGYKAAHEGYVLVKDREWSARLERYAGMLPDMQRGIPVPDEYKRESPGSDADLGAYDVVYVSGQANEGAKTIAFNLPNDEEVQLRRGTRRVQLKNVMRQKFEHILAPIADVLIDPEQRHLVTFDAFFDNTMFHEVAHGLGIKNTLDGTGTVREALREHYSPLEEGKADVLGLYFVTRLYDEGEDMTGTLEEHYVTFMASIFRSVRFGASSAHGVANMVRFHFFRDMGAFTRDDGTGTYRVDMERMRAAMNALTELVLTLQGDGDYEGAGAVLSTMGGIGADLQADLDRLAEQRIPVDLLYEQGMEVLRR